MTLEEFVRLSPKQIRSDERLMQLFIDFYEAAFSFKPKCAGCAFKKGFKKLQVYAKNPKKIIKINTEKMEQQKTFKIKKAFKLKVLSFKKDGVIHRSYGHKITEAFALELVQAGKTNVFEVLPKEPKKTQINEVKEINKIDYEGMNYRKELLPLYEEVKTRTKKQADSNKKADVISFLRQNES